MSICQERGLTDACVGRLGYLDRELGREKGRDPPFDRHPSSAHAVGESLEDFRDIQWGKRANVDGV